MQTPPPAQPDQPGRPRQSQVGRTQRAPPGGQDPQPAGHRQPDHHAPGRPRLNATFAHSISPSHTGRATRNDMSERP